MMRAFHPAGRRGRSRPPARRAGRPRPRRSSPRRKLRSGVPKRPGAGERAPDLLAKARRAWDEGRLASTRGEGTTATRRLEEAREYARAAEAQANAERTRSEAATLKQQADELEARTRQIRSAPTP